MVEKFKSSWDFYRRNLELDRMLREAESFAEIKRLFERVTPRFYNDRIKGENRLLVSARTLFVLADIHFTPRNTPISTFVDILEGTKDPIPFGQVEKVVRSGSQKGLLRYYFTLTRFEKRAINILQTHTDLQKFRINPVRQVSGPPAEKLPTTTEFASRSNEF